MKPTTAIKLATILSVFLTSYFVYEAATKGFQSISLQDWLSFLLDIGIGIVIVGAALIKMRQVGKRNRKVNVHTNLCVCTHS